MLKIADFGLSKSLKLGRPAKGANDASTKSCDSRKSMDASVVTDGGSTRGHGSAPAYKLTGETGSYR